MSDRIEEGQSRTAQRYAPLKSLERVYTAGLRLGIEAHALVNLRKEKIHATT